jgi:SAM-dependent methyltransferase
VQNPNGGLGRWARDRVTRRRQSAFDLSMPWISYPAIDFLDRYLQPSMLVYEYGSGGSTVWLAQRARHVVAVEHDPQWAKALTSRLVSTGLDSKVDLRLREVSRESREAFVASPYAQAMPDAPADLIIIDGPDRYPWLDLRLCAFHLAEERVKPGGVILLDDSSDYRGLRYTSNANEVRSLPGFGPGRGDLGHTDAYIY